MPKRWTTVVLLAILAVVSAAFAYALGQVAGNPWIGVVGLAFLAAMLGAYAGAIFLAVAIHELGHYLAGRAVGFRLRSFVVGPLGLRPENGRLVLFRVRPVRLLGFVAMLPEDDERVLRRYTWFILGGPVASLLYAAAVYLVATAGGSHPLVDFPRGGGLAATARPLVGFVLFVGALVVLPGTLVPYRAKRVGGFPTDAMWLLILARGGDEARRLAAMLTLMRMVMSGAKSADLPRKLIDDVTRLRDGSLTEMNAQTLRWGRTMDSEPDVAREAIGRHAEIIDAMGAKLVEPMRSWARLIQATNAAFLHRDPLAAAAWSEGIVEVPDPAFVASYRVLQAMLAALRNDPDLPQRIDAAEFAIDAAAEKTTVSWDWDRARVAELRAGWPNNGQGTNHSGSAP